MKLLTTGIETGKVVKTDRAAKLCIGGETRTYPIYKVALDELYYNDQNDRIATWIRKYMFEHAIDHIDMSNLDEYNDIIQGFIVESNPDKIQATQRNIEIVGQLKNGVVLNDGRVIDGNRRFTCLRRIAEKNGGTGWFETIILDKDIQSDRKQIKMLELQIQMGEEARVEYHPIDRITGMYLAVIENKDLSAEEYATSANMTLSEVKKELEIADLMTDMLVRINAKGMYHIAKELDAYGPLVEVQSIVRKANDADEKDMLKHICYANILAKPDKDMTRFIRRIKGIIGTELEEKFIDKELEATSEFIDELSKTDKMSMDIIKTVSEKYDLTNTLSHIMAMILDSARKQETKDKPKTLINQAISNISDIDMGIVQKLDKSQLEELRQSVKKLISMLNDFESEL